MRVGCFVTGSVCLEPILWNSPPPQHCNLQVGEGHVRAKKNFYRNLTMNSRTAKLPPTCASILLQSTWWSSRSRIHSYSSNHTNVSSVASHHANYSWSRADRTWGNLRGTRGHTLPRNQTQNIHTQRVVGWTGTQQTKPCSCPVGGDSTGARGGYGSAALCWNAWLSGAAQTQASGCCCLSIGGRCWTRNEPCHCV